MRCSAQSFQRLKTNSINPAVKVVITTIQRPYSMLKSEAEFDTGNEEGSAFDTARPRQGAPPEVVYNVGIPPEFFDFIIVDECHRSIYKLCASRRARKGRKAVQGL
jgi:type I restriction enzyme R subunit